MALKAVLFGLEGVLIKDRGNLGSSIVGDLRRLFDYLRANNIEPIILSNRDWVITNPRTDATSEIDGFLNERYGPHTLYVTTRMGLPPKPSRAAAGTVLSKHELSSSEVIYIGNSEIDFRTAINSDLLFINAIWERQEVGYGFVLSSPSEVGRFISAFGLKQHPWYYQIDDPIQYRSMAPFSTHWEDYREYSLAARQAAKTGTPERHFFLKSLVASLHFSGLTDDINYIACYPGHKPGFGNPFMDDVLAILGDCFRANYIPDLIVRRTQAPKSQLLRIRGRDPDPLSQLNTICLTKLPLRQPGKRYKTPVRLSGKTVLVIDDFCTEGYSLEAARLFLEEAGANVILVSWLKTINRGYNILGLRKKFDPYKPQQFDRSDLTIKVLPYGRYIVDNIAPEELKQAFEQYRTWQFPE